MVALISSVAHIDSRRRLELRVSELDGQFRQTVRPTALVEGPQPHDEMMVVEIEARRIEEEDLAHLVVESVVSLLDRHVEFLGRVPNDLPKIPERLGRHKVLRLQDHLALVIVQRGKGRIDDFDSGFVHRNPRIDHGLVGHDVVMPDLTTRYAGRSRSAT